MAEQDGIPAPPGRAPLVANERISNNWLEWFANVVRWMKRINTIREDNVSDPPTDTQFDTAFGTPAAVGDGFIGILDDNSGETDVYICFARGDSWFYIKGTKAV